ncbi:hypothetical protein ARMSODRAFT_1027009 [Armillaria solidipes]|uniref:Uncharacterized protein n=1 Tax=Armillaria solidipes TaxID=1076256 RepID=A0A2H3AMB8_9AGAR|nr:hypothetical protein ARMSODRAFT_1027009 [Armillaria solidipes]
MSSLPPSRALSIAPSPHLSHAPSPVQGPLSHAPSIGPSPLPSHAPSPTQTSLSCAPSVAPSPVQSQAPTPIQPANPSMASDGDSDQNAMEAGQNEIVRNSDLLKVQEPKLSTLRNSGPLKNTSGKKRTREDNDVEPRPLKKGKKKNRCKILPVGAVSKLNEVLPSPSSMNKDDTTHSITESLPHVAPWWAVDGLKENFRELAMFGTYQCPQAIRDWIACSRLPKFHLQPVPKGVDPVKEFDGKFWAWWSSLQLESRPQSNGLLEMGEDGRPLKGVDDDWDLLKCPGANGWLSVIAGLCFWAWTVKGMKRDGHREKAATLRAHES